MTGKEGFWRRASRWITPGAEIPGTQGKIYKVTTKGVSLYPPNYQEPSSAQTSHTPARPSRYPLIEKVLSGSSDNELRERERARQDALNRKRVEAYIEDCRKKTLSYIDNTGLIDMFDYAAQISAEQSGATNFTTGKVETAPDDWYKMLLECWFSRTGCKVVHKGIKIDSRGIENWYDRESLYIWEDNDKEKLQVNVAKALRVDYWIAEPPPIRTSGHGARSDPTS